MSRCYSCSQENCGRLVPSCSCPCHKAAPALLNRCVYDVTPDTFSNHVDRETCDKKATHWVDGRPHCAAHVPKIERIE